MQISPKVQMIIAAIVAIMTLLSKGTVALPLGVPDIVGQYITSWDNFILQIYAVAAPIMLSVSSSAPGPLAPPDPPAVVAAQKVADLKPDDSPSKVDAVKRAAIAAVQSRDPKAGSA